MKIVVGLGNPGERYARTLHNAGFAVIDKLAEQLDCSVRRSLRFPARIGRTVRHGEALWLVKPQTFMNLSGAAVGAILRYAKASPQDLVVVLDDADLSMGRLRIRCDGSSGGHRGLASVLDAVGTRAVARVRVGIGRSTAGGAELADYVLKPRAAREWQPMAVVVDQAAQAVLCIIDSGADEAMNRYNSWVSPSSED